MPRIRKTSTQPKRKVKKFVEKSKPVYPEFLQIFIQKVEFETPFIVKVDQYSEGASYHVGVLQKQGKIYRCIWMVGFANSNKELNVFWTSECYKNWKQNNT